MKPWPVAFLALCCAGCSLAWQPECTHDCHASPEAAATLRDVEDKDAPQTLITQVGAP